MSNHYVKERHESLNYTYTFEVSNKDLLIFLKEALANKGVKDITSEELKSRPETVLLVKVEDLLEAPFIPSGLKQLLVGLKEEGLEAPLTFIAEKLGVWSPEVYEEEHLFNVDLSEPIKDSPLWSISIRATLVDNRTHTLVRD